LVINLIINIYKLKERAYKLGAPRGNCNRAKNKARCHAKKGTTVSGGAKYHLSTLGEIYRRKYARFKKYK
jgi:hypothetical protein